MDKRNNILDEAARLTDQDRQQTYGNPKELYARLATIWSGILGYPITPGEVVLCMAAVKLGRLSINPDHRDSVIDLAGYARIYERLIQTD